MHFIKLADGTYLNIGLITRFYEEKISDKKSVYHVEMIGRTVEVNKKDYERIIKTLMQKLKCVTLGMAGL